MSLIQHSNDFLLSLYVIDNVFNRKTQITAQLSDKLQRQFQIASCTISCDSYQRKKRGADHF